jgi:hypothetical protein
MKSASSDREIEFNFGANCASALPPLVGAAVLRREAMTAKPPARRCAVYARKSSEEGLEQDFNSLHAQREACEAFIRSQRGEGWRLVGTAYDDGGLSGGSSPAPGTVRC